ncbi:MAG: helix-turn-helix transcriptional regulator [Chloroflexi bacterium]|nr:MAG: helix-turn-helix transcriptional regulator [Chloroflexota bacterium]
MDQLPVRQRGQCCQVTIELPSEVAEQTVEVLKALADPTRLQIVAALARSQQPVCVCDLTTAFELSQPTISHHIGKLKAAGLVTSEKQGIWVYYSLRGDLLPAARRLVDAATADGAVPLASATQTRAGVGG